MLTFFRSSAKQVRLLLACTLVTLANQFGPCLTLPQDIAAALDSVVAADSLDAASQDSLPAGGPSVQLQVATMPLCRLELITGRRWAESVQGSLL